MVMLRPRSQPGSRYRRVLECGRKRDGEDGLETQGRLEMQCKNLNPEANSIEIPRMRDLETRGEADHSNWVCPRKKSGIAIAFKHLGGALAERRPGS